MPLIIDIKVIPSSGRSKWMLDKSGQLKCYLKSPPEKGRANRELIKNLAKVLGITQESVKIIAGATSRKKKVRISLDISLDQLLHALGIEKQQSLFE